MGAPSLRRISCGGDFDWWPALCRATDELINDEASLILLPGLTNRANKDACDKLDSLESSPIETPCLLTLTSGSTGTAKIVVLTRENLLAANHLANQRLASTDLTWICALPPDHIGGFLPVFRSLANGQEPISALTPKATFASEKLHQALDEIDAPTALSLVGRQLHQITQDGLTGKLMPLSAVLIGGGPVDAKVNERSQTSGVNLITTYGMTETCGGVVWAGMPLDQTRIKIDAELGQVGVITISGPTVGWGYLDSKHFKDQSFCTNDLGFQDEAGRLHLVGRNDDVVIINGYNVSLGAVERAILQMPGVSEAVALIKNEGSGNRLIVATAPAGPTAPDLSQVRAFLSVALGRAAHPSEVINLGQIPRTGLGKIDHAELLANF